MGLDEGEEGVLRYEADFPFSRLYVLLPFAKKEQKWRRKDGKLKWCNTQYGPNAPNKIPEKMVINHLNAWKNQNTYPEQAF